MSRWGSNRSISAAGHDDNGAGVPLAGQFSTNRARPSNSVDSVAQTGRNYSSSSSSSSTSSRFTKGTIRPMRAPPTSCSARAVMDVCDSWARTPSLSSQRSASVRMFEQRTRVEALRRRASACFLEAASWASSVRPSVSARSSSASRRSASDRHWSGSMSARNGDYRNFARSARGVKRRVAEDAPARRRQSGSDRETGHCRAV